MSTPLWIPSSEYIKQSKMYRFQQYVEKKANINFPSYGDFHQWSITNLPDFWQSVLLYFDISYSGEYQETLSRSSDKGSFIGDSWFEGIFLSYAEHIFKNATSTRPAVKFASETQQCTEISWRELSDMVSCLQQYLLDSGITKGDRVVGVLNNTVETLAIFLAVNSLGAIWSCCSPDFGDMSIKERFLQISPKLLFVHSSYQYGNKQFSKKDTVDLLEAELTSLEKIISINSSDWNDIFSNYVAKELVFVSVPFSHPIWILYSSGTTGKPKAITHSTGGNLLEHYKALALHQNVQEGENFLWYTTTGWMMWNYALSSLLCGAVLCLFDGVINHKRNYTFWTFLKAAQVDHLGAGAVYFNSLKNFTIKDYTPKVIGSTGSPLSAATFEDLQQKFPYVHIISLSGGTDVCSAFLSGCPYLPVFRGQLQCITLGTDIAAYNDKGQAVFDALGELVIRQPLPSMPLYFWKDQDDRKYRESYFEKFEGVWAHGDWIKITANEGVYIYGRSDATLNRGGIRIGTAEIYNALSTLTVVSDALVITVDYDDGTAKMLLFVQLDTDSILDDGLRDQIKSTLRSFYSPRHVPDYICQVSAIPYTLSGKKLELPIKNLFSGSPIDKIVSKDIMRNPDSLFDFQKIKERWS